MNINHRASRTSVVVLMSLIVATLLKSAPLVGAAENWAGENLSADEMRNVADLAARIARGPKSPDGAAASLRADVRRLSIREAAGLGLVLLDDHKIDPRLWLALPHAREREATAKVKELQERLGDQEPGRRILETTVRGPERLRKLCGDATLTEVIGVGLWSFYDGWISAPTTFSDDDVDIIVSLPGLQWVTAHHSKLTDRGVVRLASLKHLQELRIADADVSDVSLEALGRHEDLRVLDMPRAKRVTDAGVEKLSRCVDLEELDLSGTKITSQCLPVISRLRELHKLVLSETKVRHGLSQLRTLHDLRDLELAGLGTFKNPVPADELEFVSGLKQLSMVTFENTATKRLTLKDLPNLQYVGLGHAALEDVTLVNLPKITSLGLDTEYHLPSLTLSRLEIRDLPSVTWLDVQGLRPQAADGLARGLPTMPNIMGLRLKPEMTDSLANAVGGLPCLKSLWVSDAAVTDAQLAAIARAPQLSSLRISGKSLTSTGLRTLSQSAKLANLEIEHMVLDEADFVKELKHVETLRLDHCRIKRFHINESVAVSQMYIHDGTFREFTAEGSPKFRKLSIGGSRVERLTIDSCPAFDFLIFGGTSLDQTRLWNLPALESMVLQEGTAPGTLNLKQLPSLRRIEFWAAKLKKHHIEALAGLPSLRYLDITRTGLGDDAAEAVARLKTLEYLHSRRIFGKEGLEKITSLRSLRELWLYHTRESDWTPEEARALFAHVPRVVVVQEIPQHPEIHE